MRSTTTRAPVCASRISIQPSFDRARSPPSGLNRAAPTKPANGWPIGRGVAPSELDLALRELSGHDPPPGARQHLRSRSRVRVDDDFPEPEIGAVRRQQPVFVRAESPSIRRPVMHQRAGPRAAFWHPRDERRSLRSHRPPWRSRCHQPRNLPRKQVLDGAAMARPVPSVRGIPDPGLVGVLRCDQLVPVGLAAGSPILLVD